MKRSPKYQIIDTLARIIEHFGWFVSLVNSGIITFESGMGWRMWKGYDAQGEAFTAEELFCNVSLAWVLSRLAHCVFDQMSSRFKDWFLTIPYVVESIQWEQRVSYGREIGVLTAFAICMWDRLMWAIIPPAEIITQITGPHIILRRCA